MLTEVRKNDPKNFDLLLKNLKPVIGGVTKGNAAFQKVQFSHLRSGVKTGVWNDI